LNSLTTIEEPTAKKAKILPEDENFMREQTEGNHE
jgi:hypothetical protein